ncbi:hypothetical protein GF376_05220 [Candidatus Peregrinibacteria bacterium]|nr:hypothetical protein [Candidatus Peregrinibacteria bacterium]
MNELFIETEKLIKKSNKILCIAHKKPDGDTLGALVAMTLKLKEFGKEVTKACVDEICDRFNFLSETEQMVNQFDYLSYDLIFVFDAGASYMTKFDQIYPDLFSGKVPVINIDHHASNDNFGRVNIVDVQSASTTVILFKMFKYLGYGITPDMATALLTGIYNDTGSLMHQNTTQEIYEICSELVGYGAKVSLVAKKLFRTTSVKKLKVWGKVLENLTLNEQGVTISVVTKQDLDELDATSDDLSGIVDFMNSVPGSKFTVLLNEDEKGNVKGSFRTRNEDLDLAKLAEDYFGGGGHKKASGFTMPGRLHREIRWRVIPENENKMIEEKSDNANVPEKMLAESLELPSKKN